MSSTPRPPRLAVDAPSSGTSDVGTSDGPSDGTSDAPYYDLGQIVILPEAELPVYSRQSSRILTAEPRRTSQIVIRPYYDLAQIVIRPVLRLDVRRASAEMSADGPSYLPSTASWSAMGAGCGGAKV